MRKAFIDALCEIAQHDNKIMLITGDLGYRFLEKFRDQFPKQFINIGVAEANLITVAAGLSTVGFKPFVYSIATFASMRAFEQIRNDISLMNLNVKIVGIGAGLTYAKAGPTHHSMEDIALMRLLPNMTIVSPVDPNECFSATIALSQMSGPAYLRLEHNPSFLIHQYPPKAFTIGKAYIVKDTKPQVNIRSKISLALLATGAQVSIAKQVATLLAKKSIATSIFAFPTIYPLDKKMLKKIASTYTILVTMEEHRVTGGFGSAIADAVSQLSTKRYEIIKIGLDDAYLQLSAEYENLIQNQKLTPPKITETIYKRIYHKR